MDSTPLTGKDYMTKPLLELQSHPDFNRHCMRVVATIAKMTNDQLQHLDIYAALRASNSERGTNAGT